MYIYLPIVYVSNQLGILDNRTGENTVLLTRSDLLNSYLFATLKTSFVPHIHNTEWYAGFFFFF